MTLLQKLANLAPKITALILLASATGCVQNINSNPERSKKSVEDGLIESGKCFGKYSGRGIQTRNPTLFMEIGNMRAGADYARKCAGAKNGQPTTLYGLRTFYDPISQTFFALPGGQE